MRSPVDLNKEILICWRNYHFFAKFDYLGPASKSIFSTHNQNQESRDEFPGVGIENIVLSFEPSMFSGLRGDTSRFASRHFPKSEILASCNFVGRPFAACYACSIVVFHSYQ